MPHPVFSLGCVLGYVRLGWKVCEVVMKHKAGFALWREH